MKPTTGRVAGLLQKPGGSIAAGTARPAATTHVARSDSEGNRKDVAPAGAIRGRLVRAVDLSPIEVEAWQQLGVHAVDPNPLAEPACVLAAARHLPHGDEILVLRAEQGDRWVGATPLRPTARGRRWLSIPALTSDIRRMTYLGTPLLAPEAPTEALRAMLETLESRADSDARVLVIKWLGEGPVAEAFHQVQSRRGRRVFLSEDFVQPFLYRRSEGHYTAHQSKKHLSDYRRRARRMEDVLGGPLALVNRADDPAAIEHFIELEAAGYKATTGVAMTTSAGEADYFREMCRAFAAQGRLHVLCLQVDDRIIAMQISIAAGTGLFLIKVSHDEAFARFDPGIQLHLRAMAYFHEHTNAQWIDVCTFPDNELLLRLYPDRRRTVTVETTLGRPLDSPALFLLEAARRFSARRRERASRSPERSQSDGIEGGPEG